MTICVACCCWPGLVLVVGGARCCFHGSTTSASLLALGLPGPPLPRDTTAPFPRGENTLFRGTRTRIFRRGVPPLPRTRNALFRGPGRQGKEGTTRARRKREKQELRKHIENAICSVSKQVPGMFQVQTNVILGTPALLFANCPARARGTGQ